MAEIYGGPYTGLKELHCICHYGTLRINNFESGGGVCIAAFTGMDAGAGGLAPSPNSKGRWSMIGPLLNFTAVDTNSGSTCKKAIPTGCFFFLRHHCQLMVRPGGQLSIHVTGSEV